MSLSKPHPALSEQTLTLEMKGSFSDKVQVAEAFRSAYRVLDRLSTADVVKVNLVYHKDFQVSGDLMDVFRDAAQEALAYKEALSFGRPVSTIVIGVNAIADHQTRLMASRLHPKN